MIKNLKFKIKNYHHAFGLIEVIVSTAIILIVAGAALGLGRLALKNSVISYERTQAYNLAREALEQIRSQRDVSWSEDRPDDFGSQTIDDLVKSMATEEILLDKTTFKRTVSSEKVGIASGGWSAIIDKAKSADAEITDNFLREVIVKVSWESYGKTRDTTLSTLLTDWKPADYGW